MLRTAVIAVLEPFSLSLDKSISWRLTQSLQKGQGVTLAGAPGQVQVRGVLPILQPLLAVVNGSMSVLWYLRSVLDVPSDVDQNFTSKISYNSALSLSDPQASLNAPVAVCSASYSYPLPLLLVAPDLASQLAVTDMSALREEVQQRVQELWRTEPINSTTTLLHLTTGGQALSAKEIQSGGTHKAQLVMENGSLSRIPQPYPLVTFAFKTWLGAGKVSVVKDAGSSSCPVPSCASCGTGTEGSCSGGGGSCSSCSDCSDCASCGDCSC
jgi:hypothetical protein